MDVFVRAGARVILACRSQEQADQARREIVEDTKNFNVLVKILGLSSLKSVKKLAYDFNQSEKDIINWKYLNNWSLINSTKLIITIHSSLLHSVSLHTLNMQYRRLLLWLTQLVHVSVLLNPSIYLLTPTVGLPMLLTSALCQSIQLTPDVDVHTVDTRCRCPYCWHQM